MVYSVLPSDTESPDSPHWYDSGCMTSFFLLVIFPTSVCTSRPTYGGTSRFRPTYRIPGNNVLLWNVTFIRSISRSLLASESDGSIS